MSIVADAGPIKRSRAPSMADDASRGRLNLEGKQVDTCKDFNE
jgi:hypothetical protein